MSSPPGDIHKRPATPTFSVPGVQNLRLRDGFDPSLGGFESAGLGPQLSEASGGPQGRGCDSGQLRQRLEQERGCWWTDVLPARVAAGLGESLLTGEVQGAARPSHAVWTGGPADDSPCLPRGGQQPGLRSLRGAGAGSHAPPLAGAPRSCEQAARPQQAWGRQGAGPCQREAGDPRADSGSQSGWGAKGFGATGEPGGSGRQEGGEAR